MGANKIKAGRQIFGSRKGIRKLAQTPAVEGVLNKSEWVKHGLLGSAVLGKASSDRLTASAPK